MNRKLDLARIDIERGSDYPPPVRCPLSRHRSEAPRGCRGSEPVRCQPPPSPARSLVKPETLGGRTRRVRVRRQRGGRPDHRCRRGNAMRRRRRRLPGRHSRRASPTKSQRVGSTCPRGRHEASRQRVSLLGHRHDDRRRWPGWPHEAGRVALPPSPFQRPSRMIEGDHAAAETPAFGHQASWSGPLVGSRSGHLRP